ncbi:MAG: AraC family transcriptional regulator [Proteobacteria bacterium]|nr:AraC family transcriptional regulator [Pseudomonadota bacterium]
MKPNTHKYILKNVTKDAESCLNKNVINVSRSIGNSGDWIGCGFIDKTGMETDHESIQFPFYSLVYVVKGSGEYRDENGRSHSLSRGSAFQRRPGMVHSTYIDPKQTWNEYYIDFNTEFYDKLTAIGLLENDKPVYQVAPDRSIVAEFENLMRLLDQSSEKKLPDVSLMFLGFVRDLINQGNLANQDREINDMVEKSCLDFNMSLDQRLDLKEYCKQNGWGYESFRKSFKSSIGISPVKYIVRRRLDEACRLLRSTDLRISEISVNLGYKSQYEFSNQFKRQFGVFPKHFRDGTENNPERN